MVNAQIIETIDPDEINNIEAGFITTTLARLYLGIGPNKMSNLIRGKVIKTHPHPLDERKKMINVEDIKKLKQQVDQMINVEGVKKLKQQVDHIGA